MMFTGIVEETGTINRIDKGEHSAVLNIRAKTVLEGTRTGDSIAVNGICLTVTKLLGESFCADVMHETLNRSAFAGLSAGSTVNLERAMRADGRFGGHIVSGHVDGTGRIMDIRRDDNAVWYKISAAAEVMRYIVEKGSVTVNGVSLTVCNSKDNSFQVAIIPYTHEHTNFHQIVPGSIVNLEFDIIGKYISRIMKYQA